MANKSNTLQHREVSPTLALEFKQGAVRTQLDLVGRIDSKVSTIIGFSTATVTVFGGLLAVSRREVPDASIWLLGAAGVVYLVLMLVSFVALLPREWLFTPAVSAEPRRTESAKNATVGELVWATNEFDKMFRNNLVVQKQKARLLSCALVLLILEAGLLVASSLVFLSAEQPGSPNVAGPVPSVQELSGLGPS